jgi:septal ring factor EnvC (AmiA/AmiB activator)
LNVLFSGRDFEERATEVIFILTPTISTYGKPNKEMVDMLKDRHASPMTQGLQDTVLDPLGTKARREEEQRQLQRARTAQQESEAELTATRLQAIETGQEVEELEAELEQNRAKMAELSTKAEQAEQEAQKATEEAQQAKTALEKVKEEPPAQPPPNAPGAKEQTPPPTGNREDKPK